MSIAKKLYLSFLLVSVVFTKNIPNNGPAVLTTYAKVANFGHTNFTASEGRSSGQSLYTQRGDAKIMSGQNLKNKVIYYTAKPSRIGQDKTEVLPAKGEVQERFQPRPYFFDYSSSSKRDSKPDSKPADKSKPAIVYGTPFNSYPTFDSPGPSKNSEVDAKPSDFGSNFPVYNPNQNFDSKPPADFDSKPPDSDSKPDIYDSPYNSYNPQMKPSSEKDTSVQVAYPPIAFGPSADNFAPTPSNPAPPNPAPPKTMYNSYGPPTPPQYMQSESKPDMSMSMSDNKNTYPGFPYAPPELDHPPKQSDMFMPPPPSPPHHGSSQEDMSDQGPPIIQTVKPPGPAEQPYQDYPPMGYHHHHHHEKPPPPPADDSNDSGSQEDVAPTGYGKLPDYLDHEPKQHGYHYPDDYHHHHVYHEVTTTTTTEAPEDERVNKQNYSYYYLGRKLWYIPLYFSIYFMFYITVLILKSITRHKLNFWSTLPDKGRSARNLEVHNLTANITSSIDRAQKRYMM